MNERKVTHHSAASSTAAGSVMNLGGISQVAVQITGTYVASVAFQATIDGSNWVAIQGINANTGAVATTASANGLYIVPCAGFRLFRCYLTWTSGTSITVTGIGTDAASSMSLADIDLQDATIGAVTVASGGIASGAIASGALASGSVASGAVVDMGAIADAAVAAGATGSLHAKLRRISTDIGTLLSKVAGAAFGTAGTPSADVISVQGVASGTAQPASVASGAIASGAVASGAVASGAVADGALVTIGTKADDKSTATDTTATSAISLLKEISYMEQTPASRAVTNAGTFAVQAEAPGATLALKASGAVTESANGTAVDCGQYRRFAVLLDVTALATAVDDTLDVYVDVSPDGGTTWINAVHFDQVLGNGAAEKQWAVLDAAAPGTSVIDVTTDAAEEAVRPYLFGDKIRYRCAITDAGDDDASFTFAVTAFAQ